MKISSFITTILICSLFTVILGTYYADIAANYDIEYDGEATNGIEQLQEINELSGEINQTLSSSTASSSGFNLVGDLLGSGYKAMQIGAKSFSAFTSMINGAIDKIPGLGASINTFRLFFLTLAALTIFFIIISALVNREV